MKTSLKLSVIAITLLLLNCENKSKTVIDYKFADKETVINCGNPDQAKLLNEALYSFEDDITQFYFKQSTNVPAAYNRFFKLAAANRVKFEEIATPHTLEIFDALKNNTDLLKDNSINYNSEIISCLSENFQYKDLKTTFHALVSTNSMDATLFYPALLPHIRNTKTDRNLGLYVALDFYYKNLKDLDPSQLGKKEETSNTAGLPNKALKNAPIQKNATDQKGHEGHNH
ncbi:hypothetical protein [Corallibacter sp.]|uniref:hypothetical protein n=1 Tax=Corallibacter sp. TaxID=2038084 RepID=UPI003AB1ADDE